MLEAERKIVDRFSPELKSDVIPCDTLPYLPCLTEDDREQIERKQDREGPRASVPILLDRLKKRPDSFGQLLNALESTGCQHLKKLLLEALSESQLPETPKTTPNTEKITSPPLEAKPLPPPTPSQETDLSQFPNSPSQETDCSEFPTSPSKEEAPSTFPTSPSQENEISTRRSQESDDPEYDIFVCYSHKDREVAFELRNVMTKEFNLQVCIDEVDFIPGNAISNNICDCIRCSKAIVFLLTPDFLDKKWGPWEMQQALHDLLDNKRTPQEKKIVPVLLKPCVVPNELRPYSPLTFQESSTASKMENWKRLAAAVQGRRASGRSVIVEKFNKLWKL